MRRNNIKRLILYILILWAIPLSLGGIEVKDITFHGPKNLTSEQLIEFLFKEDTHIMQAIALCESGGKQFKDTGEPISSHTNDWGLYQVNATTWDSTAKKMGLDYKYSERDNIHMAYYIYQVQGLTAWSVYNNGCYKKHL